MVNQQALKERLGLCEPGSAEYAATLSQLAELKLFQGEHEEAQSLYSQLLICRQDDLAAEAVTAAAASPEVEKDEEEDEDWENSWENGLHALTTAEKHSAAAASALSTAGSEPKACKGRGPSKYRGVQELDDITFSSRGNYGAAPAERVASAGMVLEVYSLHDNVKTNHIQDWLEVHCAPSDTPKIKWLDDERLLLIFPTAAAADALLYKPDQHSYSVRSWVDASELARQQALLELSPPPARPKTTAAVAKRLLSHALGNPGLRDRAGEKELAEARRVNREARKQKQIQKEAVWDDENQL